MRDFFIEGSKTKRQVCSCFSVLNQTNHFTIHLKKMYLHSLEFFKFTKYFSLEVIEAFQVDQRSEKEKKSQFFFHNNGIMVTFKYSTIDVLNQRLSSIYGRGQVIWERDSQPVAGVKCSGIWHKCHGQHLILVGCLWRFF